MMTPMSKVSKAVNPAAAGLILLDSRFRGNDDNGCFPTFCEAINDGRIGE